MDPNILATIIGAAALLVGILVGKLIFSKSTRKKIEEAEIQSQTILKEAELRSETIRKEKEVEAKERFIQLKAAHDREVLEKKPEDQRRREPHSPERAIHQPERSGGRKAGQGK